MWTRRNDSCDAQGEVFADRSRYDLAMLEAKLQAVGVFDHRAELTNNDLYPSTFRD